MRNEYATSVLFQAELEREIQNRAAGKDFDDYNLVDELRKELKSTLGVETSCFQDLRYRKIIDDACVPIIAKYIPLFSNIGFAQELITQQFWRKGNRACSEFLEQWTLKLIAEEKLTKSIENTLDNAFIKIQDKSKVLFFTDLIKKKDAFPFTMEMLGRWKATEALPIIIERLNADTIRTSAINALGYYKDVASLSYIEPFITSTKDGERRAAQKAAKKIKRANT